MIASLQRAGAALLDLFFPPSCSGCGKLGVLLCPACFSLIETAPTSVCVRCGAVAALDLCPACRGSSALDGLASAAVFQPPIRQAIHDLKYNGVRDMARPLGEFMAAEWRRVGLEADVLVPVALHSRRVRERGYNQSALLARVLGETAGVAVDEGLLERSRNTLPQVGLGQAQRRTNVAGAFRCTRDVTGLRLALIDDVCTTGSTLEACAAALKASGAAEVRGFTLARARWGTDRRSDLRA